MWFDLEGNNELSRDPMNFVLRDRCCGEVLEIPSCVEVMP